jgi:branched-chain amino acid transport system ATP-binding protein
MSPESALLRIDAVSKFFGGLAAVGGVSFDIREGEILGLIGPNGSGKSTMINLISGLYPLSGGEIYFEDRRISGLPPHRIARLGIGRTFQLLRLFQGLSVYDNVLTGTHVAGSRGSLVSAVRRTLTGGEEAWMRERAHEVLGFVGLAERSATLANQLTAGEGRLLELARALAADPRLILLDEPAAGLNTSETALLERKLRALQDQGKSLLLVDHEMRLMMRLASRVVVLNEGKVLAQGTPAEIQADARVIQAYLGSGVAQRRRKENKT